jgi:hypothetical protein
MPLRTAAHPAYRHLPVAAVPGWGAFQATGALRGGSESDWFSSEVPAGVEAIPKALILARSGCTKRGPTALAAWRWSGLQSRGLTPALDRFVQPRDVVAQGHPDLVIIDAMVGVGGDNPHALDLPPGNLRKAP